MVRESREKSPNNKVKEKDKEKVRKKDKEKEKAKNKEEAKEKEKAKEKSQPDMTPFEKMSLAEQRKQNRIAENQSQWTKWGAIITVIGLIITFLIFIIPYLINIYK